MRTLSVSLSKAARTNDIVLPLILLPPPATHSYSRGQQEKYLQNKMMKGMLGTTQRVLGPTIEPGSRPEVYVGVDVPAKEGVRVMMADR